MSRRSVVINLELTYTGYRVVEGDVAPARRLRPQPVVKLEPIIERRFERPQLAVSNVAPAVGPSPSNQHITLPVSSAWFDINTIHQIERDALPQFFQNEADSSSRFRKSEKMYCYYRNTIVAMWRDNPKRHLAASTCRKNLLGDVCSIMRVHAFLQNWGIINFPSRQLKGPTVKKEIRVECHVCSNKQWVLFTYKIAGQVFQLCDKCLEGGMYPQFMKREDFERTDLTVNKENASSSWTPPETLRLLELISQGKGNGDWNEVARQFPTKSKESIIAYFLTLPLTNLQPSASIFEGGQDIQSTEPPVGTVPTIFEQYRNSLQIAAAILCHEMKNNSSDELSQLWSAASRHCQYLTRQQQYKLDRLTKQLIDLTMNKLESKVVYFHDYELLVDSCNRYADQLMSSSLADLLKEVWRKH